MVWVWRRWSRWNSPWIARSWTLNQRSLGEYPGLDDCAAYCVHHAEIWCVAYETHTKVRVVGVEIGSRQ